MTVATAVFNKDTSVLTIWNEALGVKVSITKGLVGLAGQVEGE